MASLACEVLQSPEAVALRAAQFIAATAREAIVRRGRFVLALSGGSTPGLMLRQLAEQEIDWRKVHVAQVDERIAPLGSQHRNLTQLRELLIDKTSIPPAQVLPMPVDQADWAEAANRTVQRLSLFAGTPPAIDLVHLGLGQDGHTASLIPEDPAVDVVEADLAVTGEYQGWRRMTMTLPIINRARQRLWVVCGTKKSGMVERVLSGDRAIPAGRVARSNTLMLLDQAAACARSDNAVSGCRVENGKKIA